MSGLCLPVCTSRQRADAPVARGGGIAATCASVCGDRCPSSLSGSSKAGHVITLVAVPDERCSLCGPLRNSVFCLESPVSLHVRLLHHPGGLAQVRGGEPCPGRWFPPRDSGTLTRPSHFILPPRVCLEGQWCLAGTGRHSLGAPASGELGV